MNQERTEMTTIQNRDETTDCWVNQVSPIRKILLRRPLWNIQQRPRGLGVRLFLLPSKRSLETQFSPGGRLGIASLHMCKRRSPGVPPLRMNGSWKAQTYLQMVSNRGSMSWTTFGLDRHRKVVQHKPWPWPTKKKDFYSINHDPHRSNFQYFC